MVAFATIVTEALRRLQALVSQFAPHHGHRYCTIANRSVESRNVRKVVQHDCGATAAKPVSRVSGSDSYKPPRQTSRDFDVPKSIADENRGAEGARL
jgi:hypothetical protein